MYSSTSLSGPAASGCWKQLDYHLTHAHSLLPWRLKTDAGIAAHAVMQVAAERRVNSEDDIFSVAEDVSRHLIEHGRTYRGHQLPPLPADEVYQGAEIARDYLLANPLDFSGAHIVLIEEELKHPHISYSAIVDLLTVSKEGDEELEMVVAEVTDYKTSWQAGEDELDTLQRWGQIVITARVYPYIDCIRARVVNLRTWKEYTRDIYRENEQDKRDLGIWEERIDHLCRVADKSELDGRTANPGAGCLKCPYTHLCSDAWAINRDPLADAEALATRLAQTEAQRKLLIEALKELIEGELPISGGTVGYKPKIARIPSDSADKAILADWLAATATELPEDIVPVIFSLLSALKLGKGNLESFAKALMPERKKGIVQLRDEYVQSLTYEKRSAVFGVWPK